MKQRKGHANIPLEILEKEKTFIMLKQLATHTPPMTLFELAADYKDQRFSLGSSKIIWESAVVIGETIRISRVCKEDETEGKPFLMGMRFKMRYAKRNSIVHIVNEK